MPDERPETAAAVEVDGVTKVLGGRPVLRDVSLRIEPGHICGVVGPDGAGKTTLLRVILGLVEPTRGTVRILGLDPIRQEVEVRKVTGYVSQAYSLYGDLTVSENLAFYRHMYGLDRRTFSKRRDELLQLTGLHAFSDRRADALSGGMYKKLALACALLHRPRVLFLDEPTNGVDVTSRRQLWELLSNLVSEGATVVVATPLMEEADLCHHVVVLSRGSVLTAGPPERLEAALDGRCWVAAVPEAVSVAQRLEGEPWVRSVSVQASDRIRVVTRDADPSPLRAALAPLGGKLARAAPTFEDVYLDEVPTSSGGKGGSEPAGDHSP